MNAVTEVKAAHKSLATALAAAQTQMGKAVKAADNPAFKRDGKVLKYADLSSVMDACLPALNGNGIAVIQPTGEDEHGRYVETVLIHGESGETLSCRVPLIVAKNDMQGYGSAVTYGRRYGLMSMAGIAPEDDDGNAAARAAPKSEPKVRTTPKPDVDACIGYIKDADDLEHLKQAWANLPPEAKTIPQVIQAKDERKAELSNADLGGDEITY